MKKTLASFLVFSVFLIPSFAFAQTTPASSTTYSPQYIALLEQLLQLLEQELASITAQSSSNTNASNVVTNVSATPSCTLTTDRSSYVVGSPILLTWNSQNATYASFQQDMSGKDSISVEGDKLAPSGSETVTASVIGSPTITLLVGGTTGTATCTATVMVTSTPSTQASQSVVTSTNTNSTQSTGSQTTPTASTQISTPSTQTSQSVVTSTALPDLYATQGAPITGAPGAVQTFTSTVANASGASATKAYGFWNIVQVCDSGALTSGSCTSYDTVNNAEYYNSTLPAGPSSEPLSYNGTLPATPGNYAYRWCANEKLTGRGLFGQSNVVESNYGNNCSNWSTLTVSSPATGSTQTTSGGTVVSTPTAGLQVSSQPIYASAVAALNSSAGTSQTGTFAISFTLTNTTAQSGSSESFYVSGIANPSSATLLNNGVVVSNPPLTCGITSNSGTRTSMNNFEIGPVQTVSLTYTCNLSGVSGSYSLMLNSLNYGFSDSAPATQTLTLPSTYQTSAVTLSS